MNCIDTRSRLDDYLDGLLRSNEISAVERHCRACMACRSALAREQDLRERLRRLPVPEPDMALFDRAIAAAIEQDYVRRRRRWTATGGALAASIVLMIGLSVHFKPENRPVQGIPEITIALHEEREISLAVESSRPLDDATFTVLLPEGIELSGYPGQREISWVGRLEPGKNLLVLPFRAQTGVGGEVVAYVTHTARRKTFVLKMDVLPEHAPRPVSSTQSATVVIM